MMRLQRAAALFLVLHLSLGAFSPLVVRSNAEDRSMLTEEPNTTNGYMSAEDAAVRLRGLRFRLSEGTEGTERPTVNPTPIAAKLTEDEAQKVLARLPPLKAKIEDQADFNFREKSLPPPRTGQTKLVPFPAATERHAPDVKITEALQVARYSPSGEVPLAPQLSVTFSQPMVAVTSHAELAAEDMPVKLMPQPAGKWRWVGTKTLVFDPADERLPMATEYAASVAAGTKSANGATLKTGGAWTFSTPAPQVKTKFPEGQTVKRDALMFVEFDQRIDPAAVLRTVRVRGGAGENLKLRLATDDEIAADENVRQLAKSAMKNRWLAFRAMSAANSDTQTALPADSSISVLIGPGTPSAEGPRVTTKAQEFAFRTFGRLRVTEHRCSWEQKCSPFDDWWISFSNNLDGGAFDKSQVRVTPELPDAKINAHGNQIHISGLKRGRTSFKVTIASALKDEFGQTLGDSPSLVFNVGSAPPSLASSSDGFIVLDPASASRFSVYSVNHNTLKVSLYSVAPEDWEQYGNYLRHESGYERAPNRNQMTPPGKPVFSKVIAVKGKPDELTETLIDLAPALKGEFGQVVVFVESTLPAKNPRERQAVRSWVQITNIALDAFVDQTDLVGWATSLKDGRPIEGVRMEILPTKIAATSGDDGLARIGLPQKQGLNVLVARKGSDAALLPETTSWWQRDGSWHRKAGADFLRWYVFDDRKMYRPGEEVSVKGWIRRLGSLPRGDVGTLDGAAESVAYTLRDSRGNEITKGMTRLNALGGFDTKLKLPNTMNLGSAMLQLIAQGGKGDVVNNDHTHNFQVQEFRRPEFEVTTKASDGPHFVKGHAGVTVNAAYYAGGGLPNAEVNWSVTSTPGNFTPPNRGDFTFGKWTPWWGGYHDSRGGMSTTQTFTARTDAAGKHNLRVDFDSVNPPQASTVTAQASVTDVNRQAWTATTTMLVHPAELYVGVRSERMFVQGGEPLVVESIVTDLDGKAVANREVKIRSVLLDWTFEKGAWVQKEANSQECTVRSANDAVKCTLPTKEGGVYRVTARVFDDRERPNESELTLWVAGGKQPPQRDVTQQKIELIPDRKEYRAGETAEILLQAPFYPAEAVMSLRRSGIVRTERFQINEPSHTLRIPIDEAFTPNVHVQVDLVGAAVRTDDKGAPNDKLPKRPAFAKGELNLAVPPLARNLQVTATPRDKTLEPGAETTVSVEVKDAGGRGVVGSEIAVVVVDESVLALTGYKLEDPATIFYSHRGADVSDYHLRKDVLLGNPEDIAARMQAQGAGRGGGIGGGGGQYNEMVTVTAQSDEVRPVARRVRAEKSMNAPMPMATPKADGAAEGIRLRENFNALAVFAPSVPTDADGRAEVKVKVPDNLTRYRIMAVSVAGGKQFGAGESAITARMPLMVRPSAPRFLNFGDRFELPVVIQNQTDEAMSVDVAVRAANANLTDGSGRRVTVPANDRAEIRFPIAAARVGTARFQIGAASGRHSDASEIELPVWTPATTEAFATYGEIDSGMIVQPVKAPLGVVPQFGGLEITTSSTQLQALTDAVLYLVAYPYECSEQLSSRVLAVAALRDVLTAFKAKGMPSPDEMKAAVGRDIKRLQGMQNDDGGFAFWRRGDESWPYVSIHVAHALVRAKEKNFDVPARMLDKSKNYLRNIEQHIPSRYGPDARRALVAYALYVRHRMNDRDAAKARSLVASAGLEKLSLESMGWLLPVLSGDANSKTEVEAIRRHLNNHVTETAGAAHFADGYSDGNYLLLHSDRRADGVILESLIDDQPENDLIPKIVRGLLAHRKQGRWENTQENVFILLALDRYFGAYEKTTPDFVARAWLGQSFAGDQQFKGRSTERQQINVPMRQLAENSGAQNLILSKEGAGRLYYRVGMQYAPASLKLDAADYGFTVQRVYEAVDDAQDVRRESDGTWRIKAGAKVRVRLTMAAPARRYHVALVDPLPAGLEAMNPALAVTGSIPADQKTEPQNYRWWRQWFEHQNMRDERVEAFTSLLWEGVYSYSYVARATVPGDFVVPPAKAEEMYHPETFGRGATDRVVVE